MQGSHIFFLNTVLSAPDCRAVYVQYFSYLKHCKSCHQYRQRFIFRGGQFHFGYKPVKSGIIVSLLVVEYCFGFGLNLFVKANCVQHRIDVIFSQVSIGNAETCLLYGNYSARFSNVNIVKSFAHIRFYIHALNVDDSIQNLNTALKAVLEKHPDRYDILDTLLSMGATIDDNVAFTNILKQNVALYFSSKETAISNVEIDNNVSKDILLKSLKEGKLEYVIVNLTMVLERKLKEKCAEQNTDLIDMIDKAHNLNTISDFECKMLHNLRKARNGIMHQSGKFYYTEPIVKTWIKIVYSL